MIAMAESSHDSDRPLLPPIDNLHQIRELPGACRRVFELAYMTAVLPTTRLIVPHWLKAENNYPPARQLRTLFMASLLLDRIDISITQINRGISEEKEGKVWGSGQPMAEREFTFGDITFMSAHSMVELGIGSDVAVDPDEAMRADTEEEMLFAGPAVCGAFNAAVATIGLPRQRQQRRLHLPRGALPQRNRRHDMP